MNCVCAGALKKPLKSVQFSETHAGDSPARSRNQPQSPKNLLKRFRSLLKLLQLLLLLKKVSNLVLRTVNSYPLLNSNQEPFRLISPYREDTIPANAVAWGMSCSGLMTSMDSKSPPQGSMHSETVDMFPPANACGKVSMVMQTLTSTPQRTREETIALYAVMIACQYVG